MNIKPLLPLALMASLLSACGDDALPDQPDHTLHLQSVSVADNPAVATRATLGATAPISAIGIYATTSAHAALQDNAQFVFEKKGGTWSCTTTAPQITSEASAQDCVYAFSPENSSVTHSPIGNHTIPVTIGNDNFSATQQTDYLYAASQRVYSAKRTVSFEMLHALAKVSFKIVKSESVAEKLTLHKIEILSGTNRLQRGNNGTMNIGTGVLSNLAVTGSLILTGNTDLNVLQDQPNVSSLAAPMIAIETKLSFRLSVLVEGETEDRVFETAAIPGDGVQWKAGVHYVYKITVDKMGGSLTGIKIDGWKNDASQNTGIGI